LRSSIFNGGCNTALVPLAPLTAWISVPMLKALSGVLPINCLLKSVFSKTVVAIVFFRYDANLVVENFTTEMNATIASFYHCIRSIPSEDVSNGYTFFFTQIKETPLLSVGCKSPSGKREAKSVPEVCIAKRISSILDCLSNTITRHRSPLTP
jgi:hypothetical protein